MRRLAPPAAARRDANRSRSSREVFRYPGKMPQTQADSKPRSPAPKLILVQCAICGKRKILRDEWAEEFVAHKAFPCILTDGCYGFLYVRHEGCIPPMHHLATTVRRR